MDWKECLICYKLFQPSLSVYGQPSAIQKYCQFCAPQKIGKKSGYSEGRNRTRALVRARDNFTCQDCGEVRMPHEVGRGKIFEKSLDVHHVKGLCGKNSRGYDSIKDMHALITLCHRCHFNRDDLSKKVLDRRP